MNIGTLTWATVGEQAHPTALVDSWNFDKLAVALRASLLDGSSFNSVSEVIRDRDEHRRWIDFRYGKELCTLWLVADPLATQIEHCTIALVSHHSLVDVFLGLLFRGRKQTAMEQARAAIVACLPASIDFQPAPR